MVVDEMAIFKANFIPKTMNVSKAAKANIRYIQNRRGKDGAKITRALWGIDGKMERQEAYRMIDEAEKGSIFYRLVINFDPEKEDTYKDIYIRDITEQTIGGLEERLGQQVQWVAATHADHTELRHVHILAILPKRLQVQDLQAARYLATEKALEQRRVRDRERERMEQEREEEAGWELGR
jgi:hypothetical protein